MKEGVLIALLGALATLDGCRTRLPGEDGDDSPDAFQPEGPPDLFRWPTPFITKVTPPIGPTTGGITLTLDGGGFVPGAVVTVGDVPAANVIVRTAERVTLTLPQRRGRFGKVTIVLTNPDGQQASIGFRYFPGWLIFKNLGQYTTAPGALHVVAADLDADGAEDLVVTNSSGSVTVLRSVGGGQLEVGPTYGVGALPYSSAVGDLTGDGRPDIVAANSLSNDLTLLRNDGSLTFKFAGTVGPIAEPRALALADWNSDKVLDIAATTFKGSGVAIARGRGAGAFSAPAEVRCVTFADAIAAADFDGDGAQDLLVAGLDSSQLASLFGRGDGSFNPPALIDLGPNSRPRDLALGDWNGDHVTDFVVAAWTGGGLATYRSLTRDGALPGPSYATGTGINGTSVADFNLDEQSDIVATQWSRNQLLFFLGGGDGSFSPQEYIPTGRQPSGTAVADLDGDGLPDVAVAVGGESGLFIYLNRSE